MTVNVNPHHHAERKTMSPYGSIYRKEKVTYMYTMQIFVQEVLESLKYRLIFCILLGPMGRYNIPRTVNVAKYEHECVSHSSILTHILDVMWTRCPSVSTLHPQCQFKERNKSIKCQMVHRKPFCHMKYTSMHLPQSF